MEGPGESEREMSRWLEVVVALPLPRRRFTVDEYHQMARAGILGEDDRVELIGGEIVEMAPIGRRHAACVKHLNRLFTLCLGNAVLVSIHDPIRLDDHTEPQPDVALLRPRADYYQAGHPGPADTLLIVEVAETSAALDRRVKLPIYARAGIPEVWLVDLAKESIRVCRDPGPSGHRTARTVARGDRLSPLAFPDLDLTVADILGPELAWTE